MYIYHIPVDSTGMALKAEMLEKEGRHSLFDASRIICANQVLAAIDRTQRAFDNNTMIAKVWGVELLLQLSGTHQIALAISLLDVTDKTDVVIVISESPDLELDEKYEIFSGFPVIIPSDKIIERYDLKSTDPCGEVIAKGVLMMVDNE